MKIFNKYIALLVVVALLGTTACSDEDYTGESALTPTNPSVSITGDGGSSLELTQDKYVFNIALSEPQIVDVAIHITQIAGDAVMGEDFSLSANTVTIPAYRTTGSFVVQILTDELLEDTETFQLQIGDERTANASITPKKVSFAIRNVTEDVLVSSMSYSTNFEDVVGVPELTAEDVADLDMSILDSDFNVIATETEAGFDEFSGFDALDDGTYYVAFNVSSTADAGDFDETLTISVNLEFNQLGVINGESFEYKDITTDIFQCATHSIVLASVTKSGSNYTMEDLGGFLNFDESEFVGNLVGGDATIDGIGWPPLPGNLEIINDGGQLKLTGLGFSWMYYFWGEEIQENYYVDIEVDAFGNITIPEQDYLITLYAGSLYPYTIYGTGYINKCDNTIVFEYEMNQEGFLTAGWTHANGYMSDELFTAVFPLL